MNSKSVLRIAVITEWAFVVAAIVLSSLLQGALPDQLQEYLQLETEREMQAVDILPFAGTVIALPAAIVGAIGLLCLHRWARWVYLAAFVLASVCTPFSGPAVEHALSKAVDEVAGTLTGVVLAIAFFTDALGKKPRSQQPSTAPPAAAIGPT